MGEDGALYVVKMEPEHTDAMGQHVGTLQPRSNQEFLSRQDKQNIPSTS